MISKSYFKRHWKKAKFYYHVFVSEFHMLTYWPWNNVFHFPRQTKLFKTVQIRRWVFRAVCFYLQQETFAN